jgi:hypothetical protein
MCSVKVRLVIMELEERPLLRVVDSEVENLAVAAGQRMPLIRIKMGIMVPAVAVVEGLRQR